MNRVLAVYSDGSNKGGRYGGCGWYRIVQPMRALRNSGYPVDITGNIVRRKFLIGRLETVEELYTRIFGKYDLLFVQHIDNPRGIIQLFASRDYFKKKVIIDMDDDFLHIDSWSPVYLEYYPGSPKYSFTLDCLKFADALIVSTEQLKKIYNSFNSRIFVIPNRIDFDYWEYSKKVVKDDIIRIGWAGSITHERDLEEIIQALKIVMDLHPRVHFLYCGYDSDLFDILPEGRKHFFYGTVGFKKWPKRLAKLGFDIGLAPLANIPFNKGKSNIKFLEYSAYKIPGVYADFEGSPYREIVVDGKNGFLAKTHKDWIQKLSSLILDRRLREELGEKAFETSKEYSIQTSLEYYKRAFKEVLSS